VAILRSGDTTTTSGSRACEVMKAQLRQSYCISSMSLDSMVLMLAVSVSPGASNLVRRFAQKTSMQLERVPGGR
jgi:hypothetical protein